jgi:hypothetical protein
MSQKIHEYVEVAGKVVEKITATNESDYRCITIRFTDKTAFHFGLRPRITMEPEFIDWKTGNGKLLRSYPFVREKGE